MENETVSMKTPHKMFAKDCKGVRPSDVKDDEFIYWDGDYPVCRASVWHSTPLGGVDYVHVKPSKLNPSKMVKY